MQTALIVALVAALTGTADARAQPEAEPSARVALVPLDDRPACLQLPVMLGAVADAEVVTPPRDDLGRFTLAGRPEAIAKWLDSLDPAALDAVIISVDMLAYGGLVASRLAETSEADARRRLDAIAQLKQRRRDLPVYAFTTVMRLGPTADGQNDAWRASLAEWAELSPAAAESEAVARKAEEIAQRIPADRLASYRAARARNLAINRAAVELVAAGAIDFLVVARDDASARGVDADDAAVVEGHIKASGLESRVVIVPGADEVGSVLLARALASRFEYTPGVVVTYSSQAIRAATMPYEDRPLEETVEGHIAATGAVLQEGPATSTAAAPLDLFVYASRTEDDPRLEFAARIARASAAGRRVVVADVDSTGEVQGASVPFVEALRGHRPLSSLFAYASWNTAGNTIGTALAHSVILGLGIDRLAARDAVTARRIAEAHVSFMLLRLIDDFLYRGVIRADANATFTTERRWNVNRLDPAQRRQLERYLHNELKPLAESLTADFAGWTMRDAGGGPIVTVQVDGLDDFRVRLPWGRTFEVEIDLTLALGATARD